MKKIAFGFRSSTAAISRVTAVATAVAITVAASVILTGCKNRLLVDPDALRLPLFSEILSLDPAAADDATTAIVLTQLYDTLYETRYLGGKFTHQPLIAAALPSFDAKTSKLTIKIRPDYRFRTPNGERMIDALDIVYSIKRLALPQFSPPKELSFLIEGFETLRDELKKAPLKTQRQLIDKPLASVMAKDPTTVVFTLKKPFKGFSQILTHLKTAPIPRECFDAYFDGKPPFLKSLPCESGPYILKDHNIGKKIVLVQRPKYPPSFFPTLAHERESASVLLPMNEELTFQIYASSKPALSDFIEEDTDAYPLSSLEAKQNITSNTELKPELREKFIKVAVSYPTENFFLAPNFSDRIVGASNPSLRKAIGEIINKAELIQLAANPHSIAMVSFAALSRENVKDLKLKHQWSVESSEAKAKNFLTSSGYPEGDGVPTLTIDFPNSDETSHQVFEYFKKRLGLIGLKIQARFQTLEEYQKRLKAGDFQLAFYQWQTDYPDPIAEYSIISELLETEALTRAGIKTFDLRSQWKTLFTQYFADQKKEPLEQFIIDNELVIPLYHSSQVWLIHPWAKFFEPTGFVSQSFKWIKINGR